MVKFNGHLGGHASCAYTTTDNNALNPDLFEGTFHGGESALVETETIAGKVVPKGTLKTPPDPHVWSWTPDVWINVEYPLTKPPF